jgi:hypothetical protein
MRRYTLVALAIAIVLILAIGYAALASNGILNKGKLSPSVPEDNGSNVLDENGTNDVSIPSDMSLKVVQPVDLAAGQEKLALAVDYPGEGYEGLFNYTWETPYHFMLNTTSVSDWNGKVLIKVFAERTDQIGTHCLFVQDGNRNVTWWLNPVNGTNMLVGDLATWDKQGGDVHNTDLQITFNRTGSFNLTFQAFDPDSGDTLSQPVTVGPLHVPQSGGLQVRSVGKAEYKTVDNQTYLAVVVNVTNGWNVRYPVNSSNLVLLNGTNPVYVDRTLTTFGDQSLEMGTGTTQFTAFYSGVSGDINQYRLQYRDPASGQVVDVPISG